MLIDFKWPHDNLVLSFEVDEKVAYAYLKHEGHIVGDVWLYNRCDAPTVGEWQDKQNIPFANCLGYVSPEGTIADAISEHDVSVEWEDPDPFPDAYVYIGEDLFGVVGIGDRPGYARFAIRDSPLARVMEIAPDA